MNQFVIYHNPRCSKSREAFAILESHDVHPVIIDYLKTPLCLEQLKQLRAHFDLKDFVRQNEPIFKEKNLTLKDEEGILNAMLQAPQLMQRPIVTYRDKAIIARSPEKILSFIEGMGND